jgi:ABC-type nitrate/sulfonate/bicarbonate transport system ATPase subunit
MNAVSVQNITFRYSNANGNGALYEEFSLQFPAQRVTAVMGPSGCGKSTLGKILGTQIVPGRGTISWSDEFANPRHRFYMDQDPKKVFFPYQKVSENLDYVMRQAGITSAQRRERVPALLAEVGLGHKGGEHPLCLSGGEQSRLALARVLAWEPRCLILDECMGSLDLKTKEIMIQALARRASTGASTMIIITHSPNEALKLADRCLVLGKAPAQPVTVIGDFEISLARPREETSESYQSLQQRLISLVHNEL